MKVRNYINRLQELNTSLGQFQTDVPGQENETPFTDEIKDIVCHSMLTTWKYKMIEQDFHYTDSTIKKMIDLSKTSAEYPEPRKDKKNSSASSKKNRKNNVS